MALKRTKFTPRPLLPKHSLQEPFRRLITFGSGVYEQEYDAIAAAIRQKSAAEGAKTLLKIVLDDKWYEYDQEDRNGAVVFEDPRSYTPVHALRVLLRLAPEAQIGIRPLLALLDTEDDLLREEIPFYYAAMGEAAIAPLEQIVADEKADIELRIGAGESIAEIGQKHPDLLQRCIALIERILNKQDTDPVLAGDLVANLLDMGASAAYPSIERAYRAGRVDEMIVTLANVQEHFGMPITAKRPVWDFKETDPASPPVFEDDINEDEDALSAAAEAGDDGKADVNSKEALKPYVAPAKVGRNEDCPCGSGKKFKKCCGANA